MEAVALRGGAAGLQASRLRTAAGRLAAISVALVPLALGVGRFWPLYIRPGEIWLQYRSLALYPADLPVAIACLGWLVERATARGSTSQDVPLRVILGCAGLAVVSAVSALTALDPVLALGTAAHLAVLALFFVVVTDLVARRSRVPIIASLCIAAIAQSLLAVWQALTQSTAPAGALFNGWPTEFAAADRAASVAALPGVDRWLRSYGSFPHPNSLGIFLAVALILVVVVPGAPSRWRTLALAAGAVGLALSVSRTAWIAFGLAAGTGFVVTRVVRGRQTWPFPQDPRLGALAIALLVVGGVLLGARLLRSDVFTERNSLDARALYAEAAWALVDRGLPVGAGSIVLAEQTVAPPGLIGEPPHDVFLIALAELGPLGVVAWILLLAGLLSLWRAGGGPLVAVALLLPLLLLDHYLWTQSPGRTLLVWSCAVLVGSRRTSSRATTLRPDAARPRV